MDKFPEDFSTISFKKIRESNQKKLTNTVRKTFYDTVIRDDKSGLQESKLIFPKELHNEYRIILCNELLEKFDKIKITFDRDHKYPTFGFTDPLEQTFNSADVFKSYINPPYNNSIVNINERKKLTINAITLYY